MRFKNPANGYVEEITNAPLWCLLFGCIYFAVKGVWTHAVAALLLALVTGSLSWFVYPFFATQVMRTSYLRRGWIELPDMRQTVHVQSTKPQGDLGRNMLLGLLLILLAIAASTIWYAGTQGTTGRVSVAPVPPPPVAHSRPATRR